jgi:dihydroflavonol-4-reductase
MAEKQTLVTGATGFVGSAVARVLAARGHRVRVTARKGSDLSNLEGLDAETVEADLLDAASLARAVQGCRAVFHVAAASGSRTRHRCSPPTSRARSP